MKKFLKHIGIVLLALITIVVLTGSVFLNSSPQFGGQADEYRLTRYADSPNFENGKFVNDGPFNLEFDCHSIEKMIKDRFSSPPDVSPDRNIEVVKLDSLDIASYSDTLTRVTWFGHSTVLLEIDGKRLLFDPVFGQYVSPHPWLGEGRYQEEMPIDIAQLPHIDAIFISHDHYDHLDYESIIGLREKTARFFVPLGIGNHLAAWGIEWERIQEMDWWEESEFKELSIACTPSKHMSGRGLNDQFATLWSSWVVTGSNENIYFSGDGGYNDRFKRIKDKYGPFDFAMLECGQYNTLWADVHMMPEETAQAGIDLGAEVVMPIHWGSFTLATHSWTEPVERLTKEASKLDLTLSTPSIGESFLLDGKRPPQEYWWRAYSE
ncbi:MAG: MBL fold metallo-hydrolase [Flavobacteriales bacterium]|nr:MBL fold metallo-hydrolase [Flavobacteriales bacterium]